MFYAEGALAKVYVRESLRTRDYKAALRIIHEAELRGHWKEDGENGKQSPRLLSKAIEAFLADCKNPNGRNLRESTLRGYTALLGKLSAFCPGAKLVDIDPDTIRRFRDTWKMGHRAAGNSLVKLGSLFRFCLANEWCEKNPVASVQKPRAKGDYQKQPFTEEQMRAILEAAKGEPETHALLALMASTGLRISDAVMLKADQVKGGVLNLRTRKTGSPVEQILRPDVYAELAALSATESGHLFAKGSLRLETQTDRWRRRIQEVFKAAGVKGTVHQIRHYCAVSLLTAGMSTENVARILGHSGPQITSRFYSAWLKSRTEALNEELKRFWDRDKAA